MTSGGRSRKNVLFRPFAQDGHLYGHNASMKIVLIPPCSGPCAEVDFRYNELLQLDAGDGKRPVKMV